VLRAPPFCGADFFTPLIAARSTGRRVGDGERTWNHPHMEPSRRTVTMAVSAALAGALVVPVFASSSTPGRAVDADGATIQSPSRTWSSAPAPAVRPLTPGNGQGGIAGGPVAGFLSVDSDPEGDMPRELAFAPDGQTVVI